MSASNASKLLAYDEDAFDKASVVDVGRLGEFSQECRKCDDNELWEECECRHMCSYCGALLFKAEARKMPTATKRGKFGTVWRGLTCCMQGAVDLEPVKRSAKIDALWSGEDGKLLRTSAREINNKLALASQKVKQAPALPGGGSWEPSVRISGKLYHRIGPMLPADHQTPQFAQLYVFDPAADALGAAGGSGGGMRRPTNATRVAELVAECRAILRNENPWVRDCITAGEVFASEDVTPVRFVINPDERPADRHERSYDQPVAGQLRRRVFGEVSVLADEADAGVLRASAAARSSASTRPAARTTRSASCCSSQRATTASRFGCPRAAGGRRRRWCGQPPARRRLEPSGRRGSAFVDDGAADANDDGGADAESLRSARCSTARRRRSEPGFGRRGRHVSCREHCAHRLQIRERRVAETQLDLDGDAYDDVSPIECGSASASRTTRTRRTCPARGRGSAPAAGCRGLAAAAAAEPPDSLPPRVFERTPVAGGSTLRPARDDALREAGACTREFVATSYAKVESLNLNYIRLNQKQLRTENYKNLSDAVNATDAAGGGAVSQARHPALVQGGPRDMAGRYQDAMAVVRKMGNRALRHDDVQPKVVRDHGGAGAQRAAAGPPRHRRSRLQAEARLAARGAVQGRHLRQ